MVTALSLLTGKVVDVEVMSKECRECIGWRDKQRTVEFNEWWEGHQATCHANFEGSSGAMDAAGALAIFQRSLDNNFIMVFVIFSSWEMETANHTKFWLMRQSMEILR